MASYVQIKLDTTSPTANVYGPNQTTTSTETSIRIEGNEELSNIQNFYFIDALGVRHDIRLDFYGSIFEGVVSFEGFANGMAILYFELYDEVYNKSPVFTYVVNVFESRDYRLEIKLTPRKAIKRYRTRNIAEEMSKPYYGKIKVNPRIRMESTLNILE